MITRRTFLRNSSLVALAPFVPTFLEQTARAAGAQPDGRILVVVQLDGGNDGINTLVPFGDEAYARHRKELRIKTDEVLKIDDHVGFHPAMRQMSRLLEDGRLAVVQGVGYPNPNRSHFESMRIWQTARLDPSPDQRGWIGEVFDRLPFPRARAGPDSIYVGDSDLPRALLGRRSEAAAISSAEDLATRVALPDNTAAQAGNGAEDLAAYVRRSVLSAYGTARDLTARAGSASDVVYPQSKLATQLRLVAQFIKSGAATRVYYASQSGYDTHYAQLPQHEELLRELSGATKAFLDDLKSSSLDDRVVLMAFSEFGRRVAENGSLGTDHGTAGPVFLAGSPVKAGLIGAAPSLADLQSGDVKMSVDFRRVYATILQQWLAVTKSDGLYDDQPSLSIFRPA